MSQSMPVPRNKVNISEKDIEDYLYRNPQEIRFAHMHVSHWFGRQVPVPNGIIDLLGIIYDLNADGTPAHGVAVIEIKNVDVDASALTQVCRYALDVENILNTATHASIPVYKIIVAPHVSDQRYCEAVALNVFIVTFETTMSATFSSVKWTHNFLKHRQEQYETIISESVLFANLVGAFDANNDNNVEA